MDPEYFTLRAKSADYFSLGGLYSATGGESVELWECCVLVGLVVMVLVIAGSGFDE